MVAFDWYGMTSYWCSIETLGLSRTVDEVVKVSKITVPNNNSNKNTEEKERRRVFINPFTKQRSLNIVTPPAYWHRQMKCRTRRMRKIRLQRSFSGQST